MASAVLLVVAVCLAVWTTAAVDGHSTSEAAAAPSVVGEMLLQNIAGLLDRKLGSMQEAILQSSCGAGGSGGSNQEASANKLLLDAMQVKLAAMEKNQKAMEKNQEAMEKQMETDLASTQLTKTAMQAKLTAMETDLAVTNRALQSAQTFISSRMTSGSTFVRWGRKTCTNNSQVVYTGVAGGSHYSHSGAAVNMLCLTLAPRTDGTPVPSAYAFLYGAEYQEMPVHHDHDVPCSVCLAAQSSTIMVPGTLTCPPGGWTAQYTGHLVAGHHSHAAATEYNCLDGHPEYRVNGQENKDGRLLYQVITQCGSLPCPPYANGKVVTCVVCSK